MPRRNRNSGRRRTEPRRLKGWPSLVPSDPLYSIPWDNHASAVETAGRERTNPEAQTGRRRGPAGRVDEEASLARTGSDPANARLSQRKAGTGRARVHVPTRQLEDDIVLFAGGLVRVSRRRLAELPSR